VVGAGTAAGSSLINSKPALFRLALMEAVEKSVSKPSVSAGRSDGWLLLRPAAPEGVPDLLQLRHR